MKFIVNAYSDIGIKRASNQDALLIKVAETTIGDICLCVLCDGMGGLSEGELASAAVIRGFDYWFTHRLPKLIDRGIGRMCIEKEWNTIIREESQKMQLYANKKAIAMGTTVVALLVFGETYYGMNVGDSRIYKLDHEIRQLTKDQTVSQYQLDQGIISEREALVHPGRHILVQCVGASSEIMPEFIEGFISDSVVFLLTSDGFTHKVSEWEIFERMNPAQCSSPERIKIGAEELAQMSKQRRETDNLSAAIVKVCMG